MPTTYFLDEHGLSTLWTKIKGKFADKADVLNGITIDGSSVTVSSNIAQITHFSGATAGAAGTAGTVPAPAAGDQAKYLKADGTWDSPLQTEVSWSSERVTGDVVGVLTIDGVSATLYSATSNNIVGASASATANAAVSSGNTVYLNHVDDGNVTSSNSISTTGYATVVSDASGNITINVSIADATQSASGLMSAADKTFLDGVQTQINGKQDALTAGANISIQEDSQSGDLVISSSHPTITTTADTTDTDTLSPSADTFIAVTGATRDSNGHITTLNTRTYTMPTLDSTPTQNSTNAVTSGGVQSYVTSAIADLEGVHFTVVAQLPATGDASTIYLVSNSGSGTNIYDEYIWIKPSGQDPGRFELIGTTEVDLSNYWNFDNLQAISDETINALS